VLAGGRSTRFGGDKLSVPYRGKPLLDHAILRLAQVCGEVVVVIGRSANEPSLPAGVAHLVVRDPIEGQGPLVGLTAALERVGTGWALISGGDMPDLVPSVLQELLRCAMATSSDAVVLGDGDRWRPLPAALRTIPARTAARGLVDGGERRLRALVQALDPAVIEERVWTELDPGRSTLFDVDEPGDLAHPGGLGYSPR
jgi:molybdopterin-guanine dinucleotide biosynthesis protein A